MFEFFMKEVHCFIFKTEILSCITEKKVNYFQSVRENTATDLFTQQQAQNNNTVNSLF